jgi:PPP family 3-phenylpropionic acid transporter
MRTRYATFIALHAVSYMALVVLSTFLPLFLDQRGFSPSRIGTLLAIGPFVGLVAQPIWGTAGDRSRSKNLILMILFAGAGLTSLLLYIPMGFMVAAVAMGIFFFFQISIIPTHDALTLEFLDRRGWRFGPVRLAGSIGYSVMAVIAGLLVTVNLDFTFIIFCLLCLAGSGVTALLPPVPGHQHQGRRVSFTALLGNRELMALLSCSTVICVTFFYHFAFFPLYYAQMGADPSLLGWAIFVSSLPEVVLLLLADRMFERIGAQGMVILAGAVLTVRWLLMFWVRSPYVVLAVQLLHGVTFILILFAVTFFINRAVRPELKASGQALNGVMISAAARIVGSIAGGFLSEKIGMRTMYLYCAFLAAGTTVVFAGLHALSRLRRAASPQPDGDDPPRAGGIRGL